MVLPQFAAVIAGADAGDFVFRRGPDSNGNGLGNGTEVSAIDHNFVDAIHVTRKTAFNLPF